MDVSARGGDFRFLTALLLRQHRSLSMRPPDASDILVSGAGASEKGRDKMMMATPLTDEVMAKVADIVRQTLDEKFKGLPMEFDDIIVYRRRDPYDYEEFYLDIKIIYVGKRKLLDPDWTGSLPGIILPKMEAQGIHVACVPSKSFVPKHEWEEMQNMDPYDELD